MFQMLLGISYSPAVDTLLDRYGVSRVYDQQCGYTLLDAQAMHDKMISMLKLLPGGGLDPHAGKTK